MPRVKKLDLGMAALDELFMNDKERAEINSRKSLISHFRKSTISPVTPTAFLMMKICRTLWKVSRTEGLSLLLWYEKG